MGLLGKVVPQLHVRNAHNSVRNRQDRSWGGKKTPAPTQSVGALLVVCNHGFLWTRLVNSNPLDDSVDYAVGTWVVRVQSDAQTQVISEQLRAHDLIRSAQRVVCPGGNGRNDLVEQTLGFDRVR